jgi:hypothetical protein
LSFISQKFSSLLDELSLGHSSFLEAPPISRIIEKNSLLYTPTSRSTSGKIRESILLISVLHLAISSKFFPFLGQGILLYIFHL